VFIVVKHYFLAPPIWRLESLILAVLILFSSIYASITPALAASDAHLKGKFGPLHDWPIIPIAMMLMPDGRIFAYGTDTDGEQGAKLHYAVWNPLAGIGASAFETLPNTTNTDVFCAAQALIPGTGHALLIGGDATVKGERNYGNNHVNIFNPNADALVRQSKNMAFKRWYGTAVTLANGEHAILGGRSNKYWVGPSTYSSIPEVRAKNGNWRSLTTASSDYAYGEFGGDSWFYPRAWVNPQGNLFILSHFGLMHKLDTSGTGTLTRYATKTLSSNYTLPSVMFAPGRILSLRNNRAAIVFNINGTGEPVVSSAGFLTKDRQHSNATVLADGQVWVNGGSTTGNSKAGMVLTSELWNPATGKWTTTASASTARLYHSVSVLLPDGSVITGGGGAEGPLKQLNGEIYYPPYLYKKDGSGEFAFRPEIIDAPTAMIGWNEDFSIQADERIARVTLVRVGAVTHSFNSETRFFNLSFSRTGNIVTARSPQTANLAPPGFYLLFVWNAEKVPSIARMIEIG
jgi:hypothetical protein